MAQGAATKVKKRKKSVIKRAKQARMRAEINRANTTRVRTIMKRLRTAIAAKDAASAGLCFTPPSPRLIARSARAYSRRTRAIATNRG